MKTVLVFDAPGEELVSALICAAAKHGALRGLEITGANAGCNYADIAVVSRGYQGASTLKCGWLVTPDDAPDNGITAKTVVTYGMNPRSTLSFASVTDDKCMLEIRRQIMTVDGGRIDECEISAPPDFEPDRNLAVCGFLALCGLLRDSAIL